MPSVFVLMPFDKKFDSVYSDVIKDVLEREGFKVERASNIQNLRNVMRDVIQGIVDSDLIVADLTSSNANVFYELCIAHVLEKPAILITQSPPEEVPFDLRQNRVITYSTHFDAIDKIKKELAAYARRFLEGQLEIGNPVTDFSSIRVIANPSGRGAIPPLKSDDSERLTQLGEQGDWVRKSTTNPNLFFCPVCYGKSKADIPLRRDGVQASDPAIQAQYKRYTCHDCKSQFTTHPGSRYHN